MPTALTKKCEAIFAPFVGGVDQRAQGTHAHAATSVGVRAFVDMHNDGSEIRVFEFLEVDHAGIVAEWTTGSATTIIEAAITAALAAESHTEPMSATQRTNLVKKSEAY